MDKIQVTFINNNQEITKGAFDYGTKVYSVLDNFNIPTDSIYAVKINNEVRSLEDQLQYTSTIEPVLNNSKTGSAIYRRSLCLLLATACHTLFPEKRLLVGHSLGHGYFYTFENEDEVSNDVINQLRKEMEKLIEQNIPVLAIDMDEKQLSKYSNYPLVTLINTDATDINTLQSIGIEEIETIIVATPNNIEIVAVLLELNIEHIIARASSTRNARVLKQIGVDLIIRPEVESGIRTALIAANSNFIKFSKSLTELGNGFVIGSSQLLNSKLINVELKSLKFNKLGVTLVLIKRGNETFLPSANLTFNLGDELMIVGKTSDVTKFFGILNENNPDVTKRTKWRKY